MSSFHNRLKSLRIAGQFTQDELSSALGISRSAVGMYERGLRKPDFELLEAIANFFNVDTDYLLGRTDKTTIVPVSSVSSPGTVRIPVLERISTGIPIEAIDDALDWEEIPESMARNGEYFALKIHGDSMEPRIQDGDVVIVRRQPDADSQDIVIALVNGSDATCKRLVKYEHSLGLLSNNPLYDPLVYTYEEVDELPVTILGKVVELRGKF